jgi:hypothetical protein
MTGTEMYESGECERDVMIKTVYGLGKKRKTKQKRQRERRREGEELGEAQIAHKKQKIKATCHALKSRGVMK